MNVSPATIESTSGPKTSETEEPLVLRVRDARDVVTLTLNRPQAFNALSQAMLGQLQAELDAIASDESVRVVVISAKGKAFCAGHDLKEMRADPSLEYYERLFTQCSDLMLTIQRLPVPVIARVEGIATAAGCQLVAMCDLAVASSTARFAVSGVNVGLFCSTPGVALSRNILRKPAFEMLVTGEFIGAGKRILLPSGGTQYRSRIQSSESNDGLQHDGRSCARRRAGVHRKTTAALEMIEAHAIWEAHASRVLLSASRRNNLWLCVPHREEMAV